MLPQISCHPQISSTATSLSLMRYPFSLSLTISFHKYCACSVYFALVVYPRNMDMSHLFSFNVPNIQHKGSFLYLSYFCNLICLINLKCFTFVLFYTFHNVAHSKFILYSTQIHTYKYVFIWALTKNIYIYIFYASTVFNRIRLCCLYSKISPKE